MNKRNLEILGLEEGATAETIEEAYKSLSEKYKEERFMEGEVGNEAARMLSKIETAKSELLAELAEKASGEDGSPSSFTRVEELIKSGDLQEAQRVLDSFNERGAQWHYLQSVLFYRKNWVNESKKQLEIAIQLDGENQKYKDAYQKLNEKMAYDASNHRGEGANQSAYQGQNMSSPADDQLGGNFCMDCLQCCALNACLNCLCSGCCR